MKKSAAIAALLGTLATPTYSQERSILWNAGVYGSVETHGDIGFLSLGPVFSVGTQVDVEGSERYGSLFLQVEPLPKKYNSVVQEIEDLGNFQKGGKRRYHSVIDNSFVVAARIQDGLTIGPRFSLAYRTHDLVGQDEDFFVEAGIQGNSSEYDPRYELVRFTGSGGRKISYQMPGDSLHDHGYVWRGLDFGGYAKFCGNDGGRSTLCLQVTHNFWSDDRLRGNGLQFFITVGKNK